MTDFHSPRFVDASGVSIAVYEAGAGNGGAPLVLVHGWPELAYSWKNQIDALAASGRRIIALDLKGFGYSDAPRDKALYDIKHITDDLAALLDALKIDRAIFCGHDWGGAIVWPMAQLHPDRVAGVIGVCTPHKPPPPVPPLSIIKKRFGPDHYFIRFQEEGLPERVFTGREERFFQLMFRKPAPRAAWPKLFPRIYDLIGRFENGPNPDPGEVIIPSADLKYYIDAYKRSGFHGGVNLYRNVDRNYEIMRDIDPVIRTPALWIGASLDAFLPVETAEGMDEFVPDLTTALIDECGHWVMWEKPDELNRIIQDWLALRF
jgi:microsomal epoxide hydrolase/non-specific protein-tyrosine kinase